MFGMPNFFGGAEKQANNNEDGKKKGLKAMARAAILGAAVAAGGAAASEQPSEHSLPAADEMAKMEIRKADLSAQYDEITGGKTLEQLQAEIKAENDQARENNVATAEDEIDN
jgi:dsRNA-specific ribonuclease